MSTQDDRSFEAPHEYSGKEGFNSDDRPLVMGSIHGLRTFRITNDGFLSPVVFTDKGFVYKDGVNEARCPYNERKVLDGLLNMGAGLEEPELIPLHRVASKNCSCGFYAYTTPDKEYRFLDSTPGVIEGSGLVTVGSKGFRAEKAKIVALVKPSTNTVFPRNSFLFACAVCFNLGQFAVRSYEYFFRNTGSVLYLLPSLVTMACLLLVFRYGSQIIAKFSKQYAKFLKEHPPVTKDTVKNLQRHYPSVKWYKSEKAMLKDYPLPSIKKP